MPTVDVGTGPAQVFDTDGDRLYLTGESIMPDNKYLVGESPLVVGEDHASPNIDREVVVVDFRLFPGFVEVRYVNNVDDALYSAWVPDRHVKGMKSIDT
jgi:hypothetical protein